MAIYRKLQTTFWTDTKVVDDFTPEDRYFYIYLLTNPHTNLCGCYEISIKQIADETGYSKETVTKLIHRMGEIHRIAFYDEKTREMLVMNWHKYNWTSSPKFRKPVGLEINSIKNTEFKHFLDGLFNDSDTVSIPYPYPMDTTASVSASVSASVTDTVSNTDTVSDADEECKKKETIPYQEVIDMYSEICVSYPKIRGLSENRKKAIKARLNKWSLEDIREAFTKAERSDFMKGANARNWSADFDWMMNDANLTKILEGKYDNSPSQSQPKQQVQTKSGYSQEMLDRLINERREDIV